MPDLLNLTARRYSPYAKGKIFTLSDGTNEVLLLRQPIVYEQSIDDKTHTVKVGDRLDQLAYFYYRSQRANAGHYWWVIADINNIMNPLDIDDLVGQEIIIPNLDNVELRGS